MQPKISKFLELTLVILLIAGAFLFVDRLTASPNSKLRLEENC